MTLDVSRARQYLQNAQLQKWFVEVLGWLPHSATLLVAVDGQTYSLRAVAEQRGILILECPPDGTGRIPVYHVRRQIEKQVARSIREHLIIFGDAARNTQVWQWLARPPGRPTAYREHTYTARTQSADALLQQLAAITIPFSATEAIDLTGAIHPLRDTVDRDRVTRRFYAQHRREHAAFLEFVTGIPERTDRDWYAALLLNRLTFLYFLQKKGFLDGSPDYLRDRLEKVRQRPGAGQMFYRSFLLCLFQQGLSCPPTRRTLAPDLAALVGKVPYLNGGLFDAHELEKRHERIDIPNEAFALLFDFFDQYDWHLDTRPLRNDRAITPDVLGYIVEKYVNQKQMGAYYTKEDITDYISKNTIIPRLFDLAEMKCASAFAPGSTVWQHLADTPDRYLYPSVRHGVLDEQGAVIPLPADIQKGVEEPNQRDGWNRAAAAEYALPTETWREYVARRQRCLALRDRLRGGLVTQINDLITDNLNIHQFAVDTIAACEGPDLLRALYESLATVTVLDPTCGSGAFLFAALNVLQSLYEACLERMQAFVDDLDRSGEAHSPVEFDDFRRKLSKVARHPNRDAFILKSIIVNNLYGVDLMREAVEICKLRLFLKLVAPVDRVENLEPLPDIDFKILPGNALVGFATLEGVKKSLSSGFDVGKALPGIEKKAELVERAFSQFHEMQTHLGSDSCAFAGAKQALRNLLDDFSNELHPYLAAEYGIDAEKLPKFNHWRSSHQPFHWLAHFHAIMAQGGFDVVIGNPPYIKASKVQTHYGVRGYHTLSCPDVYAWCLERVTSLLHPAGRSGMIVPLSIGFSKDFAALREKLFDAYCENWFSSFGRIPSALFMHDVRVRNTIHLAARSSGAPNAHTTALYRWNEEARAHLFQNLSYARFDPKVWNWRIPKLNSSRLAQALEAWLTRARSRVVDLLARRPSAGATLYFKKTAYNSLAFSTEPPPCVDSQGNAREQSQLDALYPVDAAAADALFLFLNGKIAFVFWCTLGDDFHVTKQLMSELPFELDLLGSVPHQDIQSFGRDLKIAMKNAIQFKRNAGMNVGSYNLALCRGVTDQSDRLFAEKFGLSEIWEDLENYCIQVVRTCFADRLVEE